VTHIFVYKVSGLYEVDVNTDDWVEASNLAIKEAVEKDCWGEAGCSAIAVEGNHVIEEKHDEPDAMTTFVNDVVSCARCGGNHTGLVFKFFTNPSPICQLWAQCPSNGEPILMRVEGVKGDGIEWDA
jgi:hypothetical protein